MDAKSPFKGSLLQANLQAEREVASGAERKAARDARYAARKSRK